MKKNENEIALLRKMYAFFKGCFYIHSDLGYMRFSITCINPVIHIVLKPRNDLRFGIEVVQGI